MSLFPDGIIMGAVNYVPSTLAQLGAQDGIFMTTPKEPKLTYMIRNPLSRVVSHYIHDLGQGLINTNLPLATRPRTALIPQKLHDLIRGARQMQDHPTLSKADKSWPEPRFAADYADLKALFPDRHDLRMSYPFVNP